MPTDSPASAERRCSPRLDATDLLIAELASVRARVAVAEVGLGGFSVITDFPLEAGSLYRFRFSRGLADDAPARVRARAIYSRRPADAVRGSFVTGLSFVNERPRDRRAIGELLDHVMSPLSVQTL
ncbi:MAG: hypothetical protein R2752_15505 [Vicinamibacterales bacterium]